MSTPTPRAILALREAHSLLMAAITAHRVPPGPLLVAAVEVADALEAAEDGAVMEDERECAAGGVRG